MLQHKFYTAKNLDRQISDFGCWEFYTYFRPEAVLCEKWRFAEIASYIVK
jgi:hypothetical protein